MKESDDIRLVPVDKSNWPDCAELRLHPAQKGHLASNLKTIAESAFEAHYVLRAIQSDKTIVGMLAYCPEIDEPIKGLWWLFRIMIDRDHQGKGYGKRAVELALEEMRTKGATHVRTMCRKDNLPAKSCYTSMGFKEMGFLDDGDCLFEISLVG